MTESMTESGVVTDEFSSEESSLRASFQANEQELERLQNELAELDRQRVDLAEKGQHYDVLGQVCQSLEELDDLGAGDLFWPEQDDAGSRQAIVQTARGRMETYNARIEELEGLRAEVLDRIGVQNRDLDLLQYDLDDIAAQREARKN